MCLIIHQHFSALHTVGGGGHKIVCDFDLVPTSWLIGHRMSHVRHAKYEDATYCVTREVLENV